MLKAKPVVAHSKMWKEIIDIIDKQLSTENRITGLVKNFGTVEEIADYLCERLTD